MPLGRHAVLGMKSKLPDSLATGPSPGLPLPPPPGPLWSPSSRCSHHRFYPEPRPVAPPIAWHTPCRFPSLLPPPGQGLALPDTGD